MSSLSITFSGSNNSGTQPVGPQYNQSTPAASTAVTILTEASKPAQKPITNKIKLVANEQQGNEVLCCPCICVFRICQCVLHLFGCCKDSSGRPADQRRADAQPARTKHTQSVSMERRPSNSFTRNSFDHRRSTRTSSASTPELSKTAASQPTTVASQPHVFVAQPTVIANPQPSATPNASTNVTPAGTPPMQSTHLPSDENVHFASAVSLPDVVIVVPTVPVPAEPNSVASTPAVVQNVQPPETTGRPVSSSVSALRARWESIGRTANN